MYIPSTTCPNCGYCPHCGRGGVQAQPYQPTPYYPQPQPIWISSSPNYVLAGAGNATLNAIGMAQYQ